MEDDVRQTPPTAQPDRSGALSAALRRVADGDRRAFQEVYTATSAKLFGVCLRLMPDRAEAEEALQDTYLSVWRSAASFDAGRGRPMTWLLTLTRNRAIDRLRSHARIAAPLDALDDEIVDPAPLAAEIVAERDQTRRMIGCLDGLPQQDARFIRAAFFEGSTYARLAERSAMPTGTVKSRIRRALLKLRDCLQ